MSFFNFVMALSPIVVVLVGILGFRQSAKRVAPVALLWTLLLAFTYFNVSGASFKDNVAVYDAAGRIVWNDKQWQGQTIDLSGKPAGVYILNINNTTLKFRK